MKISMELKVEKLGNGGFNQPTWTNRLVKLDSSSPKKGSGMNMRTSLSCHHFRNVVVKTFTLPKLLWDMTCFFRCCQCNLLLGSRIRTFNILKNALLDNFELPVVIFWTWISWCKSWTDMNQTIKRAWWCSLLILFKIQELRHGLTHQEKLGPKLETPLLFDPLALMYIYICMYMYK